jgi:hypothetical protein
VQPSTNGHASDSGDQHSPWNVSFSTKTEHHNDSCRKAG